MKNLWWGVSLRLPNPQYKERDIGIRKRSVQRNRYLSNTIDNAATKKLFLINKRIAKKN